MLQKDIIGNVFTQRLQKFLKNSCHVYNVSNILNLHLNCLYIRSGGLSAAAR